ncbi:Protein of unknown function [Lentzea waywayandensis]|uniref:DUF3558 domain-containing protein n=1 Tax=Lentzea waywayandensis TaxID=84724 RepID=A0A1I6E2A7_9PSEU|nr:DUF3558 family protein [Lentzea waywayandensis]SFR11846.1 Protein of unknown function [Lentzea waywayandensis]
MKRTLFAAVVVSVAALSTACTTGGTAKPDPTSGSTSTGTTGTASGLEAIKPCDLLTQTEATGLGLAHPGEAEKTGTADGCQWTISGDGGVSTGIRTKAGVKDLNISGDKNTDVKVGKFDAVKSEGFEGAKNICALWISVTETSSVSVIANVDLSSTDMVKACDRAAKAADFVAAKLP